MKLTVLALSTVLLCSPGAFAQSNAPATSPDSPASPSSSMSTQPSDANGGSAMQNNANPNGMDNTTPMNNRYRHHHGGGWGWIGLFGLLGLFGLGGSRRNRDDVVAATTPRTRL